MNREDFLYVARRLKKFRFKKRNILHDNFWVAFKELYPQYAGMSNRKLSVLMRAINRQYFNSITERRDGFELPYNLGLLFVATCPRKKKPPIDEWETTVHNRPVIERNDDTDSYLCKIFYTNFLEKYNFAMHEVWGFKANAVSKKVVSDAYKENWPIYVRIDPLKKVTALFRQYDASFRNAHEDKDLDFKRAEREKEIADKQAAERKALGIDK